MIAALLAYQLATSNPERDVIQASMLGMLKGEKTALSDWPEAKSVVLHSEAIVIDHTKSFSRAVALVLRRLQEDLNKGAKRQRVRDQIQQLEALTSVKDGIAGRPMDLRKLSFDSRIAVIDRRNYEAWADGRICGTVHRPSFSLDGNYASLQAHLNWSIHGSEVTFILRKSETGWERIAANVDLWL